MSLSPALVMALSAQCAPGVAPETLLAVARAESALNPLAIGVNGAARLRPRPASASEAVARARELIAGGHDIDLGLGQINVRNLRRLGLTLEAAFDPCANLAASARVLREGYARGRNAHGPGQAALRVAFSIYNTGDVQRGFRNGYVARVVAYADLKGQRADAPPQSIPLAATPPEPPAWDVFGRAAVTRTRLTFSAPGATP